MGGRAILIRDKPRDFRTSKSVKVRIPIAYHVRLHTLKALTGVRISDAVTEALRLYFHQRSAAPERGETADEPRPRARRQT